LRFSIPAYEACSFCEDLAGARECAIVAENAYAVAQVNERQYERGAMLIIPRAHRESILDIGQDEIEGVYRLVRQVAHAAAVACGAVGMNVFQNNGSMAGQTEPHFHVHVVPRYEASDPDRRFMHRHYTAIPIEEQRAIAAVIRTAL
jgi:histidine triad (HIT) family protein